MAFKLAEAFVEVVGRTASWDRATERVKSSVESLRPHFDRISTYATAAFASIAAASGFAIQAFAGQEDANNRLRNALMATGQEVENNFDSLSEFAGELQNLTNIEDDAALKVMAYATNLGATADQMREVIRGGVGLGEAFFNGNVEQGTRAFILAQKGSFRELQRLIPELRDARDAQEQMAIVLEKANAGFMQAVRNTQSFKGQVQGLKNDIGDLAEEFGGPLVGRLRLFVAWARTAVAAVARFVRENEQMLVTLVKWGLGLAAVVMVGPRVISLLAGMGQMLWGLTKLSLALGQALLAALLSPIGPIVAGLGLIVSGLAYIAGTGDTVRDRLVSGFKRIWDAIRVLFENASNLSMVWENVTSEAGFKIAEAWSRARAMIQTAWVGITAWFSNLFDDIGDRFVQSWISTVAKVKELLVRFQSWHRRLTTELGDAMARKPLADKVESARREAQRVSNDPNASGEERDAAWRRVRKAEEDLRYIDDMHEKSMNALDEEAESRLAAIHRQRDEDLKYHEAMKRERQAAQSVQAMQAVADINRQRDESLKSIDQQRRAFREAQRQRIADSGMGNLVQRVEGLWGTILEKTGMKDLMAGFQKIQEDANALAGELREKPEGPEKPKPPGEDARPELKAQDAGSVFRERLARLAFRHAFGREKTTDEDKRHREAQDHRKKLVAYAKQQRDLLARGLVARLA